MELYSKEEIESINKNKESNDKLEEYFQKSREEWSTKLEPLFESVKIKLDKTTSDKIIESQSYALSYKQILSEQISVFLNKRSKEDVKMKKIRQNKFLHYATGFGLKTNLSEKTLLIDAHIAENERTIQLIDIHIEFLRDCSKNLNNLHFIIKNIIELYNYLK